MRQGDAGDFVCIVVEGRVKLALDTVDGRGIILDVLGPGDMVGEFEALGDHVMRAASVIALDSVVGLVMSRTEFRDYLLAYPAASLALVRATIQRLDTADRRRIGRTGIDASHALARYLVELVDQGRGPAPICAVAAGADGGVVAGLTTAREVVHTELHGSVFQWPTRCLVRRPLGRHPSWRP